MTYRIESAISGIGYDLTLESTDHAAAARLVEQAGQTRRADSTNLWTLWRDNELVAQVRCFDGYCIYWGKRSFHFDFHGLQVSSSQRPHRAQ